MPEDQSEKIPAAKFVELKIQPHLGNTPLRDHILSIVKAVLSAVPYVGPVVSLVGDYIPTAKAKRFEEFIVDVALELEEIKQKIDKEYLKTEKFEFILERSMKGVLENYQEQKRACYRGILLNSLLLPKKQELKEYFLYLVDNLTETHLRMLAIFRDPEGYFDLYGIDKLKAADASMGSFFILALDLDLNTIKAIHNDLYRLNLLNTESSIYGTMTAATGFELVRGRLSTFGTDFVNFCTY